MPKYIIRIDSELKFNANYDPNLIYSLEKISLKTKWRVLFNGHYETKYSQRKLSGRQILLVSQITPVDMCQKIAASLGPEKRYDTFLDF